jgi:hypothetical protein
MNCAQPHPNEKSTPGDGKRATSCILILFCAFSYEHVTLTNGECIIAEVLRNYRHVVTRYSFEKNKNYFLKIHSLWTAHTHVFASKFLSLHTNICN